MKKFGFVDIIIILLVVALLAVGYKIVSDKEGTSSAAISDVEFTVELSKLDKEVADMICVGDDIYDSLKGGYYGKVVDVKVQKATELFENTDSGSFVISEYPDKYNAYVTIHGTPTSITDGNILFASQKVKVGLEMFLKSKNYVGIGYAVGVDVLE